jgi:hypothetical protein
MKDVLAKIHAHFDQKKDRFPVFAHNNTRVEGWFKGELLCLFTELDLHHFETEKKFCRPEWKRPRRVDFALTKDKDGEEHLIELKALMLSSEEDDPRKSLSFYFNKDFIPADADKLRDLCAPQDYPENVRKWLLIFIYPAPDAAEWDSLLAKHKLQSPENVFVQSDTYSIALISI